MNQEFANFNSYILCALRYLFISLDWFFNESVLCIWRTEAFASYDLLSAKLTWQDAHPSFFKTAHLFGVSNGTLGLNLFFDFIFIEISDTIRPLEIFWKTIETQATFSLNTAHVMCLASLLARRDFLGLAAFKQDEQRAESRDTSFYPSTSLTVLGTFMVWWSATCSNCTGKGPLTITYNCFKKARFIQYCNCLTNSSNSRTSITEFGCQLIEIWQHPALELKTGKILGESDCFICYFCHFRLFFAKHRAWRLMHSPYLIQPLAETCHITWAILWGRSKSAYCIVLVVVYWVKAFINQECFWLIAI